jgi:hypothetical protein
MPRQLLQAISGIALAGTILPAILFLVGAISLDMSKNWLLAATVAWFIATPLWMGRKAEAA